jgi:hypothetical protein
MPDNTRPKITQGWLVRLELLQRQRKDLAKIERELQTELAELRAENAEIEPGPLELAAQTTARFKVVDKATVRPVKPSQVRRDDSPKARARAKIKQVTGDDNDSLRALVRAKLELEREEYGDGEPDEAPPDRT